MKISGVDTHHVALPTGRTLTTAIHSIDRIHNVLVEISADGLVGSGYAFAFTPHQAVAIRAMVHDLAEAVEGRDASMVGQLWERCWTQANFVGPSGVATLALSAIDTALWDLMGQRAGLPLNRLLGAVEDELTVYATGGWLSYSLQELIEEAERFVDEGFEYYKFKIGLPDWREDVRRCEALRDRVGDRLHLLVDANQAWRPAEAVAVGRALEPLGLYWFEEPVAADDIEGSAAVAAALAMPVASGESLFGVADFRPMIEQRAADVLMPDLMRCGGPTGYMRVIACADAAGLPVSSHVFTEVSAHLMAAARNATLVEHIPGWWDGLFEGGAPIEGGRIRLGDTPGLGFRFADAAKRDHRVE